MKSDFLILVPRAFEELSKGHGQCLIYYCKPLIAAINGLYDGESHLKIKIGRLAGINSIDLISHMYSH